MAMNEIKAIPRGTSKGFYFIIELEDGTVPDISGDVVTFIVKADKDDPDSAALINEDGDVTTEGALGKVIFTLSKTDTDLEPGTYPYDATWYLAGGEEEVIWTGKLTILTRVSDV